MKHLLFILFFLITYSYSHTQDMTVSFDDFDDLSVASSVSVTLIPGNQNRAEIDIEKGDKDDLVVKQNGDKVSIYWKSKNWNWGSGNNRQANIDLYYTSLEVIDVSAGAKVDSRDDLVSNQLDANVNSGGSLELEVDLDEFECNVNSGGYFKIEGEADIANVKVNSGGSLKAADLQIKDLEIRANSGGAANIWVTEKIDARANSGGSIKYKGDPKIEKIKKDKWSGGSVVDY